jgi:hypothetical protein
MNATARGSSTELVHHAKRAAWYALVTMILTSVHHAYGAFVYATPWRLHVVAVSAVIAPLVFIALAALRKNAWNRTPGAFAFWSFFLVTFIFPVAGIGVFEGAYNHVVKNVLYFGGAPVSLLHALFPPGIYELPDNAIFELTGVVQTVPALMAGWELVQLVRARTSY